VAGACLIAWLVVLGMRHMMVVEHKSRHSFDETVERIKKIVEEAEGWVFLYPSGIFRMR